MGTKNRDYFQDHMHENVCFGCGIQNDEGLHVKSYWEDKEAVCQWQPEEKYHGWSDLLNGGIIATLIDCHCMCTAMAHAYKEENRDLNSLPEYRYATGTLNVKYLLPTSTHEVVQLRAKVIEVKNKKTVLWCDFYSKGKKTAEAEVIAIRVFDSSQGKSSIFKS
ncbi:MAG: PaaI family thioesterase [Reichenbachiella sp.]